MKAKISILTLFILFAATTFAADLAKAKDQKISDEKIIENLLTGIKSDNYGLRTSAALLLGDFVSSKSVIPLMKMLHSESTENARIIAALSLYKIGDPVGIFAVKRAIRFDDSKRVRKMCEKFYYDYLNKESNIQRAFASL